MQKIALLILCAALVLSALFGAVRAKAGELSPQLEKTYRALQQHQPVYRIRLDGTPTPAEADLAALASACLAGVGTAEDGEYYHPLNATERQACIDWRRTKAGLIGLTAIVLLIFMVFYLSRFMESA